MFWDGERWIDERAPAPTPRPTRRRGRDWLATGVMIVAVAALAVPFVATSAGSYPADRLVSSWSDSYETRVFQETTALSGITGEWDAAQDGRYLGSGIAFSGQKGASFTFTFTGTAVSWVGTEGPDRGKAKVSVDGEVVRTVDTRARSPKYRETLFSVTYPAMGTHIMTIEVLGTPERPIVDIDAFVVRGARLTANEVATPAPPPDPTPAPTDPAPTPPDPTATLTPAASPTPAPSGRPAPSATPTASPTASPVAAAPLATPVPTSSVTPTATPTPTPTPRPTVTPAPTPTPTPRPTVTPAPTPTPTPRPTVTPAPTPTPTPRPTVTPAPTPTPTPRPTVTPAPTPTPTPRPTATPWPTPTPTPWPTPTPTPTPRPTATPWPTPTPAPSAAPAATTVRVSSIPALKTALADNTVTEIVVANGTYHVSPSNQAKSDSLWIGSAASGGMPFAERTRPVTVRAETIGGVTFDGGGGSYYGGLSFEDGAHDQTWVGFNFANMAARQTGIIEIGAYTSRAAPHHITLRHITIERTCSGRATTADGSAWDHAIYMGQALAPGPHDLLFEDITVDGRGGLATAFHFFHGADNGGLNAHEVVIRRLTVTGTQQAVLFWEPSVHDIIVDTATISGALAYAIRYEGIGGQTPHNIVLQNITSVNSGYRGFYSSLGAAPAGVLFIDNSLH